MIQEPPDDSTFASCTLNWRDFRAAQAVHRVTQPNWLGRMIPRIAMPILLLLTVWVAGKLLIPEHRRFPRRHPWPSQAIILTPAVLVGWLFVAFKPLIRRLEATRQVGRFAAEQLDQSWLVDDEGLWVRTPQVNAEFRWDYYRRVVESRDIFLLYVTAAHFQVVPTRAFSSGAAMNRFAALARRHVADYVQFQICRYPAKPGPVELGEF